MPQWLRWRDTIQFEEDCQMSTIISLKDVATQLGDLIHRLNPGEEVVIVENDRPVATLVVAARDARRVPKLGTQPGSVLYMAPDFDAPLDDFQEYME